MNRRDISTALFTSAAGSALAPHLAQAQTCNTPCYAQTAAEIAAHVTPTNYAYTPYPIDLRRYGADPTGMTPSDSAMTSALAVCATSAQNGGTIWLPAGTYLFAKPISLNQMSGVTIKGDGNATGGAGATTFVEYSGTTSAHFIQMTSSSGCWVRGLQLKTLSPSSAFSGAFIRCGSDGAHGDSVLCGVSDVTFNGTASCYHLDLDLCIEFAAERCNFTGGATSVKGQAPTGNSHSNAISFYKCQWTACASVPVNYGGEAWGFDACTFEPLANGAAGAFTTVSTAPVNNIAFHNCWFGDAGLGGGTWVVLYGAGFVFSDNFCTTSYTGQANTAYAIQLFAFNGAHIHGNIFENLQGGISFSSSPCTGIVIQANAFDQVANALVNPGNADPSSVINPNVPLLPGYGHFFFYGSSSGTAGWEYNANGGLELWGSANVTSGTPVAVSFSALGLPNFGTAMLSPPVLGLVAGASSNVPSIASGTITLTGFTLEVSGSGSNVVYWRCKGK